MAKITTLSSNQIRTKFELICYKFTHGIHNKIGFSGPAREGKRH